MKRTTHLVEMPAQKDTSSWYNWKAQGAKAKLQRAKARADFADHVYASSEAKPKWLSQVCRATQAHHESIEENGADDYLSDEPTGPEDIYDIGSEADRNI